MLVLSDFRRSVTRSLLTRRTGAVEPTRTPRRSRRRQLGWRPLGRREHIRRRRVHPRTATAPTGPHGRPRKLRDPEDPPSPVRRPARRLRTGARRVLMVRGWIRRRSDRVRPWTLPARPGSDEGPRFCGTGIQNGKGEGEGFGTGCEAARVRFGFRLPGRWWRSVGRERRRIHGAGC